MPHAAVPLIPSVRASGSHGQLWSRHALDSLLINHVKDLPTTSNGRVPPITRPKVGDVVGGKGKQKHNGTQSQVNAHESLGNKTNIYIENHYRPI